jgi:hypothetical protein
VKDIYIEEHAIGVGGRYRSGEVLESTPMVF